MFQNVFIVSRFFSNCYKFNDHTYYFFAKIYEYCVLYIKPGYLRPWTEWEIEEMYLLWKEIDSYSSDTIQLLNQQFFIPEKNCSFYEKYYNFSTI